MISRLDQQIFVTKTMIDMYQLKNVKCKKLRNYMLNYLAIMMTVSSILCIRSKKAENLEKKKRTVDISETERFQDIYEDPIRNTWTDHEHPGKTRTKDFFTCLQCSKKNYRI